MNKSRDFEEYVAYITDVTVKYIENHTIAQDISHQHRVWLRYSVDVPKIIRDELKKRAEKRTGSVIVWSAINEIQIDLKPISEKKPKKPRSKQPKHR